MGRKRTRSDSKLKNKCAKRYIDDDDWISRLPDDILVDILSLLSLDEAARTSVLSSRWMNLWEHTKCLNLDGDTLHKIQRYGLLKIEVPKYVRWVNRILQSHKAITLKEFRLRFNLGIEDKKTITRWLEFAFARHVERLELDFRIGWKPAQYRFPEELLTAPSDSPRMLLDFNCLRALLFTSVDVTDRVIDLFLHNCPSLEQFVVCNSRMLSNVELCGSSLVLKHFEIDSCGRLESLKVSAPSLTYLKVPGALGSTFLLENAPMLVEIYIDCNQEDIQRLFSTLSSHASQLEILRLRVVDVKSKDEIGKLPELPKLKKLLIEHFVVNPEYLVGLSDMIRASPCLEEFVFEVEWSEYFLERDIGVVEDAIKSPHHHLKVVRYCGYYGCAADLQFVSYILENCVALENLIIDPCGSRLSSCDYDLEYEKTGRKNAKQQLQALVPRHIELVIL